ncbi:DUF3631 domain-containing protein [Micromonospora sp. NPDC048898]|uniref:DUF3631 domain-containing protein n=1 Tax=Micromonospora sp. NPDC048898 TaxID=3364260 RepID=UPI003723252A
MALDRGKARAARKTTPPADDDLPFTTVEEMQDALRAVGVDPAEDDDIEMQFFVHHREEIQEHQAAQARQSGTMDLNADLSGAEGIPSGPEVESKPAPKTPRPPRPFVPGAGARVLDEVEATVRKYVVLPNEEAYVAVTLWAAATHGMPAWEHATRLVVISAVKGCGKTRLFEVLQPLCEEPLSVSAASTSAIFRSISDKVITIFHDEADTVFGPKARGNAEDLRGLYNSGFTPGAGQLVNVRGEEGEWTPQIFRTFAMVAIASKGVELPDTIMDRAVVIRMRKKLPSETVAGFRQKHIPEIRKIGGMLEDWVATVPQDIEPETPLDNREADLWEPLLILADAAGGAWPTRARQAAVSLIKAEDGIAVEDRSLDLLRDIKRLWPKENGKWATVVSTSDLLELLHSVEESSWDRHDYGRPITDRQVADLLRGYSIAPRLINVKGKRFRGYRLEMFKEVSARYLDQ